MDFPRAQGPEKGKERKETQLAMDETTGRLCLNLHDLRRRCQEGDGGHQRQLRQRNLVHPVSGSIN